MSDARMIALGDHLRRIRRQQGMSLADVQERSDGVWKAVVVGAYERGDRSITLSRLEQLARFYGVPMAELLSAPTHRDEPGGDPHITLDLHRLADAYRAHTSHGIRAVTHFASHVRRVRGDHNGRVLTLRTADLATVASSAGSDADELLAQLIERGAVIGAPRAARDDDADPDRVSGARQGPDVRGQLRTANRQDSRSTKPAAR